MTLRQNQLKAVALNDPRVQAAYHVGMGVDDHLFGDSPPEGLASQIQIARSGDCSIIVLRDGEMTPLQAWAFKGELADFEAVKAWYYRWVKRNLKAPEPADDM